MARIEDTLRELAANNSGLVTAREAASEGIAGVLLIQLAQRAITIPMSASTPMFLPRSTRVTVSRETPARFASAPCVS